MPLAPTSLDAPGSPQPALRVADFDFDLPRRLIAARPVSPRDRARLLVLDEHGQSGEGCVRDLPALLRRGDILVLNDTRVIPAQLSGKRGQATVGCTLHRRLDGKTWRAFAKGAGKLKVGDEIIFGADLSARVIEKGEAGEITLCFNKGEAELREALERFGAMPLPPYIGSQRKADDQDRTDYQTIYAQREGAVAAPTAGLHFTPDLFHALEEKGILVAKITLHVGAGTFLPVKAERLGEHKMHAEWGEITPPAAERINRARANGGRVVAVGTTALRLMESACDEEGMIRPFCGQTDIFITPGFDIRSADILLTNFHLPRSTLFMLVCAFAGTARMKALYAEAIEKEFRFFSYGDACLLWRRRPA